MSKLMRSRNYWANIQQLYTEGPHFSIFIQASFILSIFPPLGKTVIIIFTSISPQAVFHYIVRFFFRIEPKYQKCLELNQSLHMNTIACRLLFICLRHCKSFGLEYHDADPSKSHYLMTFLFLSFVICLVTKQ